MGRLAKSLRRIVGDGGRLNLRLKKQDKRLEKKDVGTKIQEIRLKPKIISPLFSTLMEGDTEGP